MNAVIFDLDDTLVNTRRAFTGAIDAAMRVLIPELTQQQSAAALAQWRQDRHGHYRAYTQGKCDYWHQREQRMREIAAGLGLVSIETQHVSAWNDAFDHAFAAGWTAFDDARSTVDRLQESGYAVGVLTNAQAAMQERKMAATGLADLPLVVTMDTFGIGKPDARVFLEACRVLDVDPAAAVYVGDELDTDARGAHAAGLRGMWLARPGHERGGDHDENHDGARASGVSVLTGLDELFALL